MAKLKAILKVQVQGSPCKLILKRLILGTDCDDKGINNVKKRPKGGEVTENYITWTRIFKLDMEIVVWFSALHIS